MNRFIVEGIPASNSLGYVKQQYKKYLEVNHDFKRYLLNLKVALNGVYPFFDDLFNSNFENTSMVLGKDSLLNILVKLYNYKFGMSQTIEYLVRCETYYKNMISKNFEMKEIHLLNNGCVEYYFQQVDVDKEQIKTYYPFELYLISNNLYDNFEIEFQSDIEYYEDSWSIFGKRDISIVYKMVDYVKGDLELIIKYQKEIKEILNGGKKFSISYIQSITKASFANSNTMFKIIKKYLS